MNKILKLKKIENYWLLNYQLSIINYKILNGLYFKIGLSKYLGGRFTLYIFGVFYYI